MRGLGEFSPSLRGLGGGLRAVRGSPSRKTTPTLHSHHPLHPPPAGDTLHLSPSLRGLGGGTPGSKQEEKPPPLPLFLPSTQTHPLANLPHAKSRQTELLSLQQKPAAVCKQLKKKHDQGRSLPMEICAESRHDERIWFQATKTCTPLHRRFSLQGINARDRSRWHHTPG